MKRLMCSFTLVAAMVASTVVCVADRPPADSVERAQDLIPFLGSSDPHTRGGALYQLVQIGSPAIPPLLNALSHGDSATKHVAATALGYIGTPAVPGLITLLRSDSARRFAGSALVNMGVPAVPFLLDTMQKENDLEPYIAYVFSRMGSRPVPYLIETLRTRRGLAASVALLNIGEPALTFLFEELKGPDERMVPARVQLGMMGNTNPRLAEAMIPHLVAMLRDQNGKLTRNSLNACSVLGRIGPPALPEVEQLLDDRSSDVRFNAIIALGLMHSSGKPALPRLRAMLKTEKDAGMRDHVRITIRQIESADR